VPESDFTAADEELQARIYNAFNPLDPATPEQYFEMTAARGADGALVREVLRHIKLARTNHVRFLFSGHIGSGKSTELLELRQKMLNQTGGFRYFPVVVDTNDYLADYDADAIDLLLAIVAELAAALREHLKIDLSDTYFQRRFAEIRDFLLSEVEATEADLTLAGAKVKLRRLKADETARAKVREALRPQVSTILAEINSLLDAARVKLQQDKRGFNDIILIIDNLEKIRKVSNAAEGFPSQKELFLEQYTKLTGFNAHVIYTVPLRLVRSADAPQLNQRYDGLFILPAVKTRDRAGKPFVTGCTALSLLIARRIAPAELDDVIDADALQFLLDYSGGHVRHLMLLMRAAIASADSLPIDLTAARRAIQQLVGTYSTSIPDEHWDKLLAVERSLDQRIANGDPAYLSLLENAAILEYRDGEVDDPFEAAEPWYAVHPIVRQLKKFKERVQQNGSPT
jgi:hypothetical protein